MSFNEREGTSHVRKGISKGGKEKGSNCTRGGRGIIYQRYELKRHAPLLSMMKGKGDCSLFLRKRKKELGLPHIVKHRKTLGKASVITCSFDGEEKNEVLLINL